MNFLIVRRILSFLLILGLFVLGIIIHAVNQSRTARFRVDVFDRFLHAYERAEDKNLKSFFELPSFHLISTADSLSLKDTDLKQKITDGYIYDWQIKDQTHYVISASPIGIFTPAEEYGITEDGKLRMNSEGVDERPDTYMEVKRWKEISRNERVRSAKLPEYITY